MKNLINKIKNNNFPIKKEQIILYFLGIIESKSENIGNFSQKIEKFLKRAKLEKLLESTIKKGFIEKNNFSLTQKGFDFIKEKFPVFYGERRWEGWFYMVIFDIPEKYKVKRELFRRTLKKLKLGKLQNSIWITPFDVYDNVEIARAKLDISPDYLHYFKTTSIIPKDLKEFSKKIWNIQEIEKKYNNFIKNFGYIKSIEDAIIGQFEYLSILNEDPQLPVEFIGKDWKGFQANEVYKKTVNSFINELNDYF